MTSENETDWRAKGLEFENAGQLAQARIALSYAFQKSPTLSTGLLLASLLIQIRDRGAAGQVFDLLGETFENRTNKYFCFLRGDLEKSRNNFDGAADWYQQVDSPNDTSPMIFLGSCYARQGKLDQAVEVLLKATELPYEEGVSQPDEAWVNIAMIERARGNLQSSLDAANRAFEYSQDYQSAVKVADDVSGAISLSTQTLDFESSEPCLFALSDEGKCAQAMVVAKKRVAAEPEWIQAQTKIGILLISFRRFGDAEKHIEWLNSKQFFRIFDDSWRGEPDRILGSASDQIENATLELRAHLEEVRGNLGLATVFLERLVERLPIRYTFGNELADCLCLQERYDEALEVCDQVIARTSKLKSRIPAEEDAFMTSGLIHRARQQYLKAAEIWNEGANRFPDNDRFSKLASDAIAAEQLCEALFGSEPTEA